MTTCQHEFTNTQPIDAAIDHGRVVPQTDVTLHCRHCGMGRYFTAAEVDKALKARADHPEL